MKTQSFLEKIADLTINTSFATNATNVFIDTMCYITNSPRNTNIHKKIYSPIKKSVYIRWNKNTGKYEESLKDDIPICDIV